MTSYEQARRNEGMWEMGYAPYLRSRRYQGQRCDDHLPALLLITTSGASSQMSPIATSATTNGDSSPSPQHRVPLQLKGILDDVPFEEITPVIGREYTTLDVRDLLKDPQSDAKLRELAIISTSRASSVLIALRSPSLVVLAASLPPRSRRPSQPERDPSRATRAHRPTLTPLWHAGGVWTAHTPRVERAARQGLSCNGA